MGRAVMLIDPQEGKDLYSERDYPTYFMNRKHPLDYQPVPEPIVPEFIVHQASLDVTRMILRISWKTKNETYLPMSFLVDLNSDYLFLTTEAFLALDQHGLVHRDEDWNRLLRIHYGKHSQRFTDVFCRLTPGWCRESNVIGFNILRILGLRLDPEGFHLKRIGPWF